MQKITNQNSKKGKKVLKIILVIIVILIIIFLIHTIRNYIIITNLQNRVSEYANSTNYYIKSISNDNNKIITMEYYEKENNKVVVLQRNINGEITKISMYNDGEGTDTFIETKDSKIVQLNSISTISVNIYNHLETDNNWQTLLGSIFSKIKTVNYNGKECYNISTFMTSTSLNSNKAETIIEKDTGLFVKSIEDEIITYREYEFNNIQDSVFIKPSINDYTISN